MHFRATHSADPVTGLVSLLKPLKWKVGKKMKTRRSDVQMSILSTKQNIENFVSIVSAMCKMPHGFKG